MSGNVDISICLWFERDMEEAVNHYTALFDDGRITQMVPALDGAPVPPGSPLCMSFELAGQRFLALNGRPDGAFDDAISIVVACRSQAEIDRLWQGLLAGGGREKACGWLSDRYGVSWQIMPDSLPGMLADEDEARAGRVMQAMMGMIKLDIAALEAAYNGH